MSIAFLPVTNSDSSIYNEMNIKEKWNTFLESFANSLGEISNEEIDIELLNKIVERSILKHYSIENKSGDDDKSEIEDEKKEVKKERKKREVKKKEVKERCKHILTNNEQCKSKQIKDSEFCSRHTEKNKSKSEESESSEESD